jgi:hypothetical protein
VPHLRLLVSCADRPGVVAAISGFLAGRSSSSEDRVIVHENTTVVP